MKKRRKFSQRFKGQAIQRVFDGQSLTKVSNDLQVGKSILYKWVYLQRKKERTAAIQPLFTELIDKKLEDKVGFELDYCQVIFRLSKHFDSKTFSRYIAILKELSCWRLQLMLVCLFTTSQQICARASKG